MLAEEPVLVEEEPEPPEPPPAAIVETPPVGPDTAAPEPAALFPSHQVIWRETSRQTQPARRREDDAVPMPAIVLLFLLGAGMFAGGAYLVLNTAAPGPAWALAALGAVCLAVSIYAGLRRIGDRDD
jgi:hypothetical protein